MGNTQKTKSNKNTLVLETKVNITSEIGKLNAVILHRPGVEIERMTPENIHTALYSDLLNKRIVDGEYANFSGVFEKCATTYYVEDLLRQLVENEKYRQEIVTKSCKFDGCEYLIDELMGHPAEQLASELITGFAYRKGKDPDIYETERYILKPLYNLFFTRDASSAIYNQVLIHPMSYQVRKRETLIFDSIFRYLFRCETIHPQRLISNAGTEGGDTLIARYDTLCIGTGSRTNKNGINFLVEKFSKERPHFNILVQELPQTPESFIHLDMVFTFLDKHCCMTYKPIIEQNKGGLHTFHIKIDNGKAEYVEKPNFLQGLEDLGFDMRPVSCGGDDPWNQQREQWHSGANFFALGEGKVIGYQRNWNTIEAMNKAGFDVVDAADVVAGKDYPDKHRRCVVTFAACELPRGCGGARCMTMPVNRDEVEW